jgi:hypothetical protein
MYLGQPYVCSFYYVMIDLLIIPVLLRCTLGRLLLLKK